MLHTGQSLLILFKFPIKKIDKIPMAASCIISQLICIPHIALDLNVPHTGDNLPWNDK